MIQGQQQQMQQTTLNSQQPPSSQGGQQLRANLNLKQIDDEGPLVLNGQPLSPTQTSSNRQRLPPKDSGRQKALLGPPTQVGLTTIEYAVDPKAALSFRDIAPGDLSQMKDLYDGLQEPPSQGERVELKVVLPFEMAVEQVELQIANHDAFTKYLKVLRIEGSNPERPPIHLRGGFYDQSKKIFEINTCCVTSTLKLCFLYTGASGQLRKTDTLKAGESGDRIRSDDIVPLIAGTDEEMDELDDEVAMISNKKSTEGVVPPELLSADDIKIEIKSSSSENPRTVKSASNRPPESRKPLLPQQQAQQSEEEPRNFNTIPRNYSEQPREQPLLDQPNNSEESGASEQQVGQLLAKAISSIKVVGFNINQIPAITSMTTFMNNSFLLKKEGNLGEAQDFDFINGVLMITTKRFTQALEIFRRIQASYLGQIEAKSKGGATDSRSKLEINKLYVKCALLELLMVESMCQAPQINDKLHCLKRMCDLFQGKPVPVMLFQPQIHVIDDPYTTILRLLPVLLRFVLMCVTHKKEIVRMSAMKVLEFVLETKGCSLDQSMVFILKAILTTYPPPPQPGKALSHQDSFSLGNLSSSVQEYFQYPSQQQQQRRASSAEHRDEYKTINEPQSGFNGALRNVYNHVLETYISVLSSISSHILHQLFYEVIIPTLTSQQSSTDVKVFAIKIAEKIITICQGDLVLGKASLDYFLTTVSQKQQAGVSEQYITALRNLWTSVRTKVFANYSQKGLKTLIDWLVDKMSLIAQNAGINNKDMVIGVAMNEEQLDEQSNPDISKLEITEEESNQLQQIFDIISVVSVSRKKNEEEANSHIKIKQDYILELYLLINPLLFWLDFSVEREERFTLFKSVYQTIKDVLENLPPKRIDIDLLQIMIPILQRTTEYLKSNSPSLSMLKFLEVVLRDIKSGGYCQMQSDLQYFFLEMLNNFVGYISYCLYEEAFSVFDKLLAMCADVVNEKVLTKCIVALVDKYTMKGKAHKNSLGQFMKLLMEVKVRAARGHNERRNNNNLDEDDHDIDDEQPEVHSKNNYFEIMCAFCFFNNEDPTIVAQKNANFRSPAEMHDLYIDKMQFYIDSLSMLSELHINMFTQMIMNPRFKATILALLQKGELSLRLKCHEILDVVTNYFSQSCISRTVYELAPPSSQLADFHKKKLPSEVMEVEYINQERLYISQIAVQCIKISLDQRNDSYLQFNSLILLDFLFQNLLPVPTFQNEQLKDKAAKGSKSNQNQSINGSKPSITSNDSIVLDIENMDIIDATPEFEVTQRQYMLMRLNLIFKLWPFVQQALNSAWSNIRSICYGLICSMLKIDIRDFQQQASGNSQLNQQFLLKLKQIVLPMLMNLLSSKESESKAGGLNILGSFCGLSYDFTTVKISKNLEFFRKNSQFISLSIWQLVFDLQDDWDITIKEASVVLIQLCAPRDAVKYFDKVKREKENLKFSNMLNRYGMGANGDQSSRLSSSRGGVDAQMQFLNSAASMNGENEDLLSGIPQSQANKEKGNILSFLSGTADDMSLVYQMDQAHQQQTHGQALSASAEMLEHITGPTGLPIPGKRNEKKMQGGISSASEEMKEEAKRNSHFMGAEFDDALQYQELLEQHDADGASHFVFFVDKYSDEQIQEIISIFRNDFKPPKNLWIEKNPSAAFNSPDYYSEIFSQAIDQFNQQQMQAQQLQQQQLQMQLSSSPKSQTGKPGGNMVDALEDDLVKKYENEKKEKERQQQIAKLQATSTEPPKEGVDNFMIFERHFEDKPAAEGITDLIDEDLVLKKDDLSASSSNMGGSDTCSIDAEPYQFLDSPKLAPVQQPVQKPKKEETSGKAKTGGLSNPQQLSLQILDEERVSKASGKPKQDKSQLVMLPPQTNQTETKKSKEIANSAQVNAIASKKTTDELIEEYERKINKTKSLLEEEKKRVAKKQPEIFDQQQQNDMKAEPSAQDLLNNLTPEFKGKVPSQDQIPSSSLESKPDEVLGKDSKSKKNTTQPPQVLQSTQLQTYLTDFQSKGYMQGQDNAKLLKQIKNCFNDNSLNHYGHGALTLSTTPQGSVVSKAKQKLNKSYENLLAANRSKNQNEVIGAKAILAKKNLSTSPRRGSSSGKKSGGSRMNNKKKYLQQQLNVQDQAQAVKSKSIMYNVRDLNFFIKNIEKDLSDKFNRMNMKDFNSMPTTPTSILKKVEDQMKALAQNKDIKAQMSNTCPNIAQVLSSLESNTSKSVGAPSSSSGHGNSKGHTVTGTETHRPVQGQALLPQGHGINFQTINSTSNMMGQSSLTNYGHGGYNTQGNLGDKFTFSKTQKIDLKETNKSIFNYHIPLRDGITHRDNSNERTQNSLSPFKDDKQHYQNLLKQSKHHKKSGKRSRGSTDKYLLLGGGVGQQAVSALTGAVNYGSSSSSYAKLNKSANNIQPTSSSTVSVAAAPLASMRKKEQAPASSTLSQQLINSFAKVNNMSPNNKKLLQQMVKHQFIQGPGSSSGQQTVSGQNSSISHTETGELNSKRGPVPQKSSRLQPKERTPKKGGSTQRYQVGASMKVPPQLDNLELSPLSDERLTVGLKSNLRTIK